METVGTFEGKTHFARLVREAAGGKTFIITKNGKPVAQIGPLAQAPISSDKAVERMLARHLSLGTSIREALNEGRRGEENASQ
jgi:prevent-host-death family protein